MSDHEQRRLAAIMFTDMVGYSALSQRDDKLALELLEEHRRLLREIFPRFNGVEIKTIGDAFLVEFGSALEAAQCAIEIQRVFSKRNLDVAAGRRVELKIGIHIGDVVHREGDVYGDGVNIASRIEPLAGAGGICISMDVERQIRNALEARFEKFSSAELKNIKLPMELFRIVLPWQAGGARLESSRGIQTPKKSSLPIFVGAAILGIALILGWWFVQRQGRAAATAGPTNESPTHIANAPGQNSVAVLPFINMSDDKGSEYFSDGISEELLTVLQKIPGLHVAARTSAFSFKGKNATAQEIGQKLGVAHLVDGSVRKSGDNVRIAARLTRADTGEQLWSENYTRGLKDVFAVQTELAQTIVEKLRGQLGGGAAADPAVQAQVQAAEKGGTKNVQSHEQYLRGRFYGNRNTEKGAGDAQAAYEKAVQLDPQFALAWAGLAYTHVWICGYSTGFGRTGFDEHLARAREASARALALEPNLPEALLTRALIQLNFDYDWKGANETSKAALVLAPANAQLLILAGNVALAKGDVDATTALYRKAVELDPVNAESRSFLAFHLAATGSLADARAEYARVLELSPTAPWAHAGLGLALIRAGKFEEALTATQDESADWARQLVVAIAQWGQKQNAESDAALAKLIETSADTAAYQIAQVYSYRNEKDKAFEWLGRAHRQRDGGLPGLRYDPFLVNLHADPRWNKFLHTVGLADEQLN